MGKKRALSQTLRKRNEHIFAEAKQYHGMGRARYRGLDPLQEQLYLTASVQNLKRLVSFMRRKKSAVQAQLHEKVVSCTLLSPFLVEVNHFTKTFTNLFKSLSDFLDKQKYFHIYCVLSS